MLVKCTHKGSSWERGDSRSLFNDNLRRQAEDWLYRRQAISYVWNQDGYRAPAWTDVDWPASNVVMGCSYVSGTGLAVEHTLPYQLQMITGIAHVNLGYPGSGSDIILDNSLRMIDRGIRPARVIIVVPELTRLTYYKGTSIVNHLPMGTLAPMYADWITHRPNAEQHGWMKLRGAVALWQQVGVPVSLFERIPIEGYALGPRLPNQIDLARDIHVDATGYEYAHCGAATQGLWADFIASTL